MAKSLDAELLTILRKFQLAGELSTRKEITNIKEYSSRQLSRLIKFNYARQAYYVLYDTSAADDPSVVLDHVKLDVPDIAAELVRNPNDNANRSYGLPYVGKDVYLLVKKSVKIRLDQELTRRYPAFSRSTIQKYVKGGYVLVNGAPATSNKQDVTENDELALTPPEKIDTSEMQLPILYIDDAVIVVNKPVGVLTHSKGALNDEFTVADFFRRYTTNGLETSRPGIVHRLDRDTSGVIIGARTDEAAELLKKQFADRTVKKHYAAIVDGVPENLEATIDVPIGRNPSAPSTFRPDSKGKSAQTNYFTVKTNGKQTLLELSPKTGRTHQLRVHMQFMKTPIAGDRIYGSIKTAPRLCLHAHRLEITIPISKRTTFEAPLPKEFETRVA